MTTVRVLAVVCLLVLAGCASPFAEEETPTEMSPSPLVMNESTDTSTSGDDSGETATATGTVTPGESNVSNEVTFPPGVSADGIDDADALFQNHSQALEETGFVATGNGSSVILQSGLLVEVDTIQRNRMNANRSAYDTLRIAEAGPVTREENTWSNGSTEYVRTQDGGETTYSTAEPQPVALLAGNGILGPYIRGANYTVRGATVDDNETRVFLNSTDVANATVLHRAIAEDADEITGYRADLVVDGEGRIRSFNATVEYTIEGQTATQELEFGLAELEYTEVEAPDWVDEARAATNETD